MHRTRVKICGVTRPQDAIAAAEAGADAIGIVLHRAARRAVSNEQAQKIAGGVPPFVSLIGLFVNEETKRIADAARELGLSSVQLHGQESLDDVAALAPLRVLKVIHVDGATIGEQLCHWGQRRPDNMMGLVLDSVHGGGSGVVNDWEAIKSVKMDGLPPLIAAGGLTPGNVGDVVRSLRPWAVDVSSGVEEQFGEKSPELMRKFILAVRTALPMADPIRHPPESRG